MKIVETDCRITAVSDGGAPICGSFQSATNCWQLYVCKSVSHLTGLETPPHREHFFGDTGRADSRRWVELIATLFTLALQAQVAA